jgi:hypothetical protein
MRTTDKNHKVVLFMIGFAHSCATMFQRVNHCRVSCVKSVLMAGTYIKAFRRVNIKLVSNKVFVSCLCPGISQVCH